MTSHEPPRHSTTVGPRVVEPVTLTTDQGKTVEAWHCDGHHWLGQAGEGEAVRWAREANEDNGST